MLSSDKEGVLVCRVRAACAQGNFLGYFRSLPPWDPWEGSGYVANPPIFGPPRRPGLGS